MFHSLMPALLSAAMSALSAQDPAAANPDAKVVEDFQTRVKQYATLHRKLEATLPPHPDAVTAERIQQHQQALERLMTRARSNAKRGDIFTESIRHYFRRQLARALDGPDGASVRRSIMDEDTRGVRLVINGRYPDVAPLSSVPPQILLLLPRLPEELEYHFVGDKLILLDIHSNTVVDFIDQAVGR